MVPYFLTIYSAENRRQVFWMSLSFMVFVCLTAFYWVSYVAIEFGQLPWIVGAVVLFLFSLFGELQFVIFALLARWIKAKSETIFFLISPFLYITCDFLYPKIFPNSLGNALIHFKSLAQIAEYTGVYGLTFLIILANISLTFVFLGLTRKSRKQTSLGVVCFAVFLTLVFVGQSWGTKRIAQLESEQPDRKLKVALVQANIGDVDKLASEAGIQSAVQKVLDTYQEMTRKAVLEAKPDLVVWPETAYPMLYTHFLDENANLSGSANDAFIKKLVLGTKTPLFFGGYSHNGRRDFNSAFLVEPEGEDLKLSGLYRKSILLAFGEYVPLGPLAPIVQEIVPTIADFGRGQGAMIFRFRGVNLGPQICYEGIVSSHSKDAVNLGADLLLNVTNDSWFGPTAEPNLHLMLTALRAIELRRPMVRATNTGFSAIIDRTGSIERQTKLFSPDLLISDVNIYRPQDTFFLKLGEAFAQLCIWLTVILLWLMSIKVIKK